MTGKDAVELIDMLEKMGMSATEIVEIVRSIALADESK